MSGLYASANAMRNLMQRQEAIANNLANLETPAFKRSVMATHGFGEALDETMTKSAQSLMPISEGGIDLSQGPLQSSERELDLALEGPGFFVIQTPQGERYTRAGNFTRNQDGEIVMSNSEGYRLSPDIVIPQDATNLTINEWGYVQYRENGVDVEGGQITLARFINPAGLQAVGGNIYTPTYASGDAEINEANQSGYGAIKQYNLETSNAEAVTELVSLIKTQRAFEMNSQVIQAANETLQEVVNLRRF